MRLVIVNESTPAFVVYESAAEAQPATIVSDQGQSQVAPSKLREPVSIQELQDCFKVAADYYEHDVEFGITFPLRAFCNNCNKSFTVSNNITNMHVCP